MAGFMASYCPHCPPTPMIIFLRHASRAHSPTSTTSWIGTRRHTFQTGTRRIFLKDGAVCCGLEELPCVSHLFHFLMKHCCEIIRYVRSSEAEPHRHCEDSLKEESNIYVYMFYLCKLIVVIIFYHSLHKSCLAGNSNHKSAWKDWSAF